MKVLIVDDEMYMVDYIRKLIDWESYGFDTVLTAKGGSLARDLLLEHEPELLITDIRMPRVSGLDLSQMTAENNGRTKVIIISGYSDFTYARQALRYGGISGEAGIKAGSGGGGGTACTGDDSGRSAEGRGRGQL